MKKNINYLLFFIFLFSGIFFGFSQNHQVLYKVSFHPQKDKSDLKTEYMRLETLSESKSIFYNYINKKDSINSKKEGQTSYLRFTVIRENNSCKYYGNFNDLYFVFNEALKTDWTINNKTSEFNGYKVQEAKIELDGRQWTALFATEVPITSGPYKFSGLPGLILKVYSEDGDYSFEMVELTGHTSESYFHSFQAGKYTAVKKKKVEKFISNFLKEPGARSFTLQNNYGDQFDYNFSGQKDGSYKDMNDYVKGVFEKYNNPIDRKTYILIF